MGFEPDVFISVLQSIFAVAPLLYLLGGLIVGIGIGAIPGLTPLLGVALLLPVMGALPLQSGLALLIGTYKGATFGGSITAIKFATPGTAASTAIVQDGFALSQKGQTVKAQKMALYASITGDTFSDLVLILVAVPLGAIAPRFGPAELTGLFFASLTLIIVFTGKDPAKGLIAAGVGFFISMIGRDVSTGVLRFTFGIPGLRAGVALVPLLLGLFALPEIIAQIHASALRKRHLEKDAVDAPGEDRGLSGREFLGAWRGLSIGSLVGTFIGALPGPGSTLASYTAYALSQQVSAKPDEYGHGSTEAIAASESANNATCGSNLIPLLTFGIPGSAIAGIFGAALMIQGVPMGPRVMTDFPDVVYTLFLLLLLANPLNLVVGRVFMGVYSNLDKVPVIILWPVIALLTVIGTYAFQSRPFDVVILLGAAVLGCCFRIFNISLAPLVLAYLIGPLFETSLLRALRLARGDYLYFVSSPIAMTMWILSALAIIAFIIGNRRIRLKSRTSAVDGEEDAS